MVNGYGPYAYRVTCENGDAEWEYLGKVEDGDAYQNEDLPEPDAPDVEDGLEIESWDDLNVISEHPGKPDGDADLVEGVDVPGTGGMIAVEDTGMNYDEPMWTVFIQNSLVDEDTKYDTLGSGFGVAESEDREEAVAAAEKAVAKMKDDEPDVSGPGLQEEYAEELTQFLDG
ncbi:hypothetical protein HTIA_0079 [Halorhabdus tiamatea SARL4B]|uniref:Uncharacterized protein n=1 Tax=Halorhabdus tiamatea SARL4B TaxID=1033806 RepID=F7PI17_9EURY|nr:hypothetical protein HTIA_0079 [Halorhabdus tiamatea SARL4B]